MESSQLASFHLSWKRQKLLMVARHDDENRAYRTARDTQERLQRQAALEELEHLRKTVTNKAKFDDEALKINAERDEKLASIQRDHEAKMARIREIQQKETLDHQKAYFEAIAARTARPPGSPAVTNGGDVAATPANDAGPATAPSQHQNLPVHLEVGAISPETSVDSLSTPAPTISAADDHLSSRTVTFEEVYQQAQAEHKDTIVEYPPQSGQWYIFKCEEHNVRFNQHPMQGAAKHLNARSHDQQPRSYELAVRQLGYRVLGCDKSKAELNNRVVDSAFANGYRPMNQMLKIRRRSDHRQNGTPTRPPGTDLASSTKPRKAGNPTPKESLARDGSSLTRSKPSQAVDERATKPITDPKAFHIYYAYWKPDRRTWPVMILGWDEQKRGGLEGNLASTGLLGKEASPPKCYIYGKSAASQGGAIIGWAQGYEDGGPKVNQRRFPVMFFDSTQSASWVSVSSLSEFPLFDPNPPVRHDHPFNAARRWVVKKEGFNTWEAFKKAQESKKRQPDETGSCVVARGISSTAPTHHSGSGPGAEDSGSSGDSDSSSASDTTEQELLRIRDTAGEIPNDDDYEESGAGSSEDEGAHLDFGLPEDVINNWPVPLYSLRSTENKNVLKQPERPSVAGEKHSSSPDQATSIVGGLRSARELSTQAATEGAPQASVLAMPADGIRESVEEKSAPHSNDDILTTRPDGTTCTTTTIPDLHNGHPSAPGLESTTGKGFGREEASGSHTSPGLQSRLSAPTSQPKTDLKKLTKRARSEGEAEGGPNAPTCEEPAKKAKLQTQPDSESEERRSLVKEKGLDIAWGTGEQTALPSPAGLEAATPFAHQQPKGNAAFELSSYGRGSITWRRADEGTCLQLYYDEGETRLSTVDGPVSITIDPTGFESFAREEVADSKGNRALTLLSKDKSEPAMTLVFDRVKGSSKLEIGKIQARRFIRWLRQANPGIRSLE
ncbi:hypothetical protein F5Y17DRAFT_423378 [Xylariaceae sp. FL0594]|nr:hypothetical protein F5Y17DRAFT_423378 [Xylariaceae sp. FL0594]